MLASSDYEGTVTLWDAFAGVKTRVFQVCLYILHMYVHTHTHTHAHTHNRFTALLEFVRDYPGEQVPER